MSKDTEQSYHYTQNRELSWLRFNRRVLEEAADPTVPALERLKFVSIFSSNLDEFFMVRVGSLFDIARISPEETDNKTGLTAAQQLHRIYCTVPGLLTMKAEIFQAVAEELGRSGIEDLTIEQLDGQETKLCNRFFKDEVLPILSPILIGPHHPVPHLINKSLYAAALLEDKKGRKSVGIVPMPESLPPYLLMPEGLRFVRTETILLSRLPSLFRSFRVVESCVLCVTRNADISFDEEKFEDNEEDFRRQFRKLLRKRSHLAVMRLELGQPISDAFQEMLSGLIRVETHQIFIDKCPLNMRYVFRLVSQLPKSTAEGLLYPPHTGRWPEDLRREEAMISQIRQQDRLLFFPYDSVDPFLKLLNEAADSPEVLSIKITIYRLASTSKIAQALCRAAENGKEVLALMELRARFDEENNLSWAKMLEESGCQIIYGTEGFKCHSKICLITLHSRGKPSYITQIGTGNYNEKTSTMYTDLSLMTADSQIGEDAATFFRNMLVNELDGRYQELCVSPYGIKAMLLRRMDEQIRLGSQGYICIKANSVTEREVIDKLREASQAGVEVQLIIRGICCLLPGVPGCTDNISITSVVGRFLEHARIYLFGRGEGETVYIASADLMTRNLNRRVEIACPVYDPQARQMLKWILETQLRDSVKASRMLYDGSYNRKHSAVAFDSQAYFMTESPHIPAAPKAEKPGLGQRAKQFLSKKLAFYQL